MTQSIWGQPDVKADAHTPVALTANSHVSEASWKWTLQPQAGTQMTVTLANVLTTTSRFLELELPS